MRLSEENQLTGLLLLFSFFATGLPRVFTSTATHTVLIDRYGAAAVPWAYVLEALLVPVAGYFFVRLENRIPLRTLVMGTLGFDLFILAALWLSYQVPALSWVAFAGIVWFEVEFALVSLLLWGMANQYMTLSQGKRRFGIVGSGEPLAVVIGGFATVPLLHLLRPADLLLLSGLGLLAGLGLAAVLTRRFTAQRDAGTETAHEGTARDTSPWRSPYVRVLMAVLFCSQLGYFLIDAAFYEQAHARFPDEQALAAFLGMASAAIGGISLLTGLFVSGPLVRRFGLRAGLLALPALLLAGSLLVVAAGHLGAPAELLFWLVVGNKLADQALRYTLDKTSSVMLLQPIAARRRNGVQAAMESIVEPLAGGVAGAGLILMAQREGFTALGITHAVLAAVALWLGLVFVQHRGYLAALRQALARGRPAPAPGDGAAETRRGPDRPHDMPAHPRGGAGDAAALAAIDRALADPARPVAVRRHAIEALGTLGGPPALARLEALIGIPERTLHRAVLRQLHRCGGHGSPQRAGRHHAALAEELRGVAWLLRCRQDLRPLAGHPAIDLLSASLAAETEERLDGLLHLVAFLSPRSGLDQAARVFRCGSDAERAYLAELVDHRMPRALRPLLAALLAEAPRTGHARLMKLCRQAPRPAAQRLADIAGASAARATPWLRSCALHALRAVASPAPGLAPSPSPPFPPAPASGAA